MIAAISLVSLIALSSLSNARQTRFGHQPGSLGPPSVELVNNWGWFDCAKSPLNTIQISRISISPDPPKIGEELNVTIYAEATHLVKEGAAGYVFIKRNSVGIFEEEYDLCQEVSKAAVGIECPIIAGPYLISHTVSLFKQVEPGNYSAGIWAYTEDHEEELFCVDFFAELA